MRIRYNNAAISAVLTFACLLIGRLGLSLKKGPQHCFGGSKLPPYHGIYRSYCSQNQMVPNDSFACTNNDENENENGINDEHHQAKSLNTVGMKRRNVLSTARSLVVAGLGTITTFPLYESAQGSATAAALVAPASAKAMDGMLSNQAQGHTTIMVPLEFCGDAYTLSYQVGGTNFRAVLDTGSPFLMIPGSCSANTRSKSGCYQEQGSPSGLEGTIEIFDGFIGEVDWRKGSFAFPGSDGPVAVTSDPNSDLIFGVVDDNIMSGPGGVFFGLIKNTAKRIRPSFLGQTNIVSFAVDLRNTATNGQSEGEKATSATSSSFLALSTLPLLPSYADYIPLNYDLRKKYGDPVQHYVAKAKALIIDGRPLVPKNGKPIYIILDTGVTGMVVNNELFEQRYHEARANKEKRLWGGPVEIMLETKQKKSVSITAQKPLTTRFDPKVNWKGFNANLMVVGLSFLNSRLLTVDIDDGKMWLED
mmetsp:Transcript_30993/g.74570  ORF Transcript_30993/g.74570 Transcript_30993/m.74570 type:complete len:476 (+) Transcript_30993:77-1504(+)